MDAHLFDSLVDDSPRWHKLMRVLLFLSSFSWSFTTIENYMAEGTPLEKVVMRMLPLGLVALYSVFGPNRNHLRRFFRPGNLTLIWYLSFGVIFGLRGIQPALSLWKGMEIAILMLWVATACYDVRATRREFFAIVKLVEILLWATFLLALFNPELGFRRSSLPIPWIQGYLPMLNPNIVGFMSVVALCRLMFFSARGKVFRIPFVVLMLLMSQSRTSYAVTAIALVIFTVDGLRDRNLLRVFVASSFAFLAALMALGALDSILRLLMRGQVSEDLDTLSGRTEYWVFALQEVSWTGGGFATASRSLIFADGSVFHKGSVNTHNSFVEALLGAGIIGALPYLVSIVFNTFRQFWRALSRLDVFESFFLICAIMFLARGITSIVLGLYSYDLLILLLFWSHLDTAKHLMPQAGPRPKPKVYEHSLFEQKLKLEESIRSLGSEN